MGKLNEALFSSKKQDWETPIDFFNKLNEVFEFEIDVAASDDNAKCEKHFTEATNGLAQKWNGTCWMNPPYGREQIKWIEKAYNESLTGATTVCLIPARPDTKVWQDVIFKKAIAICFVKGRLKFGGSKESAPFPSAVVVFSKEMDRKQLKALKELGKTFLNDIE